MQNKFSGTFLCKKYFMMINTQSNAILGGYHKLFSPTKSQTNFEEIKRNNVVCNIFCKILRYYILRWIAKEEWKRNISISKINVDGYKDFYGRVPVETFVNTKLTYAVIVKIQSSWWDVYGPNYCSWCLVGSTTRLDMACLEISGHDSNRLFSRIECMYHPQLFMLCI